MSICGSNFLSFVRHLYHRSHRPQRKIRRRPAAPTFLDGPAAGEVLHLARAPRFLRITQNGPCFRALDGAGDEPEETELIYVYQIEGRPTECRRRACQSSYHFFPEQPTDSRIRLTHAWRGWVGEQPKPSKS